MNLPISVISVTFVSGHFEARCLAVFLRKLVGECQLVRNDDLEDTCTFSRFGCY